MPIRLLSPDVVSKIAAGEVVERPASVVKELIENSLDAGASQIDIEARAGGVNLIRVSDNGTGIPKDEVELAFQHHATSKIESLDDLDSRTSLGFRGEALHSIAHVAQVDMLTRASDDSSGTFVSLRGGEVAERGVRAAPRGTTVTVRHLFRNVPARLKFLKSAATESNQISNLVSQYCMAFPGVKFTLSIDGRQVLRTPGSGRLRDAIAEVYGLEVAQAMLEIKGAASESGMTPVVSGYTSPPALSRATRGYVSFFVNGRWVQSRALAGAVERAYEGWLGVRRYPISVINIAIAPQFVDVNVHPAKREVRFSQEPLVFNAVHGAIRRALSERAPIPEFREAPAFPTVPEREMPSLLRVENKPGTAEPPSPEPARRELPILRVLGQASLTYIIAEGPDGVYLIDQHAAHERVLFERALAQRSRRAVDVQSLLEPLPVDLTLKQQETLRTGGEMLSQFGFSLEPFGDRTYLVRAVPAMLAGKSISEAVKEAIDSLDDEAAGASEEERIARSLACHGSVRAGQLLSQEEMGELIRQLEKTASPRTCPHGRPTMIHLSAGRLEREFGRA
ncbi:MAG: DNA mismatch repair endonuclease MutL [Dehalococcoidia bacterium]|nr:DNA mismatch repair endonuclease MutL [Dehalococcoidia bacterium]